MWYPWRKTSRADDVPDHLRANFEELGETVVAQIVGRPYTHATGQTPGVPVWAGKEDDRQHALAWLRETRNREKRKVWIGWGIGWGLSLIVIGIALYNLFATRHADKPELNYYRCKVIYQPPGISSRASCHYMEQHGEEGSSGRHSRVFDNRQRWHSP
jgi:hypothetical protein